VVAESGDLISHALEGITKPSTIDDEATGDGEASGLIADEFNKHNFDFILYTDNGSRCR
jgi:hypothetical protein